MGVIDVLRDLIRRPGTLLVEQWNWKSAVFSSIIRATIFLFANLSAGWHAATGAMAAEFVYRAISAGFYGALTQAFRRAQPVWVAGITVMLLLPLVSHSMELTIHLLRGTPKIVTSMIVSVCFTAISTLFNLYAMRRGVLVTGKDAGSIGADLRRVPALIASFVVAGPVIVYTNLRSWMDATGREDAARRARRQYS
jgi:hypothetical protein